MELIYKGESSWQDMTFNTGNIVPVVVFQESKKVLDLPNLIEIQTDSFKDFLDHGLKEVFEDVLPISNFTDTMELEFVGYEIKGTKIYARRSSYSRC